MKEDFALSREFVVRGLRGVVVAAAVLFAPPVGLMAQTQDPAAQPPGAGTIPGQPVEPAVPVTLPPSPFGMTDVYGNAQFDLPDRRPLGLYATDAEWEALGSYQALNRDRRGGPDAFSLPGDILGLSTMQTLADSFSPAVLTDVSPTRRLAMRLYGGFDERSSMGQDEVASAFARRSQLISANSYYSPVYRAMLRSQSLTGARPVGAPSFSPPQVDAPRIPDSGTFTASLHDVLRTDSARTHDRSSQEGLDLLAAGEYRRAARAFEAALVVDPKDATARVGEVFSYVAVGSISTAALLVRQFDQQSTNPFLHSVPMDARLTDRELIDQLLIESRYRVESAEGPDNPNVFAAYAFILWYLGDRDTAIRAAGSLAQSGDGVEYADWPQKMRAAKTALEAGSSR